MPNPIECWFAQLPPEDKKRFVPPQQLGEDRKCRADLDNAYVCCSATADKLIQSECGFDRDVKEALVTLEPVPQPPDNNSVANLKARGLKNALEHHGMADPR